MTRALRIAEQLAHDTRERLVSEGPLSIAETRRRIAARGCDVCDYSGWYLVDCGDEMRIEVCGCAHDDLTDLQRVYLDDVAQLPEVAAAMRNAKRKQAADEDRRSVR